MDLFNVLGLFLGLDCIHDKKSMIDLAIARDYDHGSKARKLNFQFSRKLVVLKNSKWLMSFAKQCRLVFKLILTPSVLK